jgi:diguanylate cyclase (GGDEF)-like protein
VVILDLDHFKQVNDTYGHACGDHLLRELGAFLRAEVRAADTVARMGSEEFMLVPPASADFGVPTVERLLTAWQQRKPQATLSVAVRRDRQHLSSTYAQADNALYQAKAAGRGQTVLALAAGAHP